MKKIILMLALVAVCAGAYDAKVGTNFGQCAGTKRLDGVIQGTGADGAAASSGAASASSSGNGSTGATAK